MKRIYTNYGGQWSDDQECKQYGVLTGKEEAIREYVRRHFSELTKRQINELLDKKIWLNQKKLLLKAYRLQYFIGKEQHDDMNGYNKLIDTACIKAGVKLSAQERHQITGAVSWKNPTAKKIIKKVHSYKANPIWGLLEVDGQVLEYEANPDLRDVENVKLQHGVTVDEANEAHFDQEVKSRLPDAWIDKHTPDVSKTSVYILLPLNLRPIYAVVANNNSIFAFRGKEFLI